MTPRVAYANVRVMTLTHVSWLDDGYQVKLPGIAMLDGVVCVAMEEPVSFSIGPDGKTSAPFDAFYARRGKSALLCARDDDGREMISISYDSIFRYNQLLEETYCWCRGGRRAEAYKSINGQMDEINFDLAAHAKRRASR